jgi:hypothetical protein
LKYNYAVGKTETEKASINQNVQQLSPNGLQHVQRQSFRSLRFQWASINFGIWFGTRGSEVQILSPRPIFSSTYEHASAPKSGPLGFWPGALAASFASMLYFVLIGRCMTISKSTTVADGGPRTALDNLSNLKHLLRRSTQ